MLPLLLVLLACGGAPVEKVDAGARQEEAPPADSGTTLPEAQSFPVTAYTPCVTDATCAPGEACTTVPGYASTYCAPPCDPGLPPAEAAEDCDVEGMDFETTCLGSGRCARSCGSPDSCPDGLGCQEDEALGAVCAGEELGQAGFYGICSHPMTDGPDCPAGSSCFGGSLIGIDNGVCLPWCDDRTCPDPPEGVRSASPVCYDAMEYGLDHALCVLLCAPGMSECPQDQECLSYGSIGICGPSGVSF